MGSQLTCHSEYGKLHTMFIHPVEKGFIHQEKINKEWKSLQYLDVPDLIKAGNEYLFFRNQLADSCEQILGFNQANTESLDAIYCRDASIATNFGMVMCRMGKAQRQMEPDGARKRFEQLDFDILGSIEPPGTLEGGDVAWLDDQTLAVGHGYRTNQEGFDQLQNLLSPKGINLIQVDLPHYRGPKDVFHLMSIFSPVDRDLAVVYSPLMPVRFRNELLKRGFDLVEVPACEFETMGCNVLALSPRKCLMVNGNPETASFLRTKGCEVHEYTGMEISLKGGGGPTCLTRPIWREKEYR